MKLDGRLLGSLFILFMLFLSLAPSSLSDESNDYPWWDDGFSYRQRIILPIDTSDNAVYQPIDISFEFEDTCWALDETKHSVRVVYQQGGRFKELESQIYNLKHTDDNHISSCGLVFLIPEEADGNERYYVYYNDEETSSVDYPDRVSVKDSYFSYEPIRGVLTETWTYNIMQGEDIIYSVAKKGTLNGDPVSQQVVKMKEGARSLLPNLGEHSISYGFIYWYKNGEWKEISTRNKLVKNEITIDGNLMVKIGIVSESDYGLLKSTVFHKYYYCPKEEKSIYSNVKHEVTGKLPVGNDVEVAFLTVTSGALKSSIVKELDYGKMPKYTHFYSEDERIKIQEFDPYPESIWEEIIGKQDDYDLGSFPWLSFDDGETGLAHGIILDSTDVVSSGENERNGVELMIYQSNMPNYPGFDGRFSYAYLCRNAYEEGEPADNVLPENYVVEYRSLYHSSENGGYPEIEKEASLYHSLIDYQPIEEEEEIEVEQETQDYNLTVYTHVPANLLLKMIGSRLLLQNSYINVELYYNNEIVGFSPSGKISLTDDLKIDWKNISFFRKAVFSHQRPREYLIKVYLVNPIAGDEKEFVGFETIDLEEDTEIHINCKPQGKINLIFNNQNNEGIKNVEIVVLKDGFVIQKSYTDTDGNVTISLPAGLSEKYVLKYYYKGFLINTEEINLNFLNNLCPVKKTIDLDVYDFEVKIIDSSEKTPDLDLEISMTSEEMQNPVVLQPDSYENGVYTFKKLVPAEYNLTIEYDSTKVTEKINIPEKNSFEVTLNDLTIGLKDLWDFYFKSNELLVFLKGFNFDKPVTFYSEKISDGEYKFSYLYPGDYDLFISYRSVLSQHNISIPVSDDYLELVFPITFNLTAIILDSHGSPMSDAEVILFRDGENVSGFTDGNGNIVFSVPPGEYTIKVVKDGENITQRNVDILNDKELNLVTSKEPWQPYAVTIAGIIFLIFTGVLLFKKNKKLLFLKLLAVILIFIALVAPWWTISGVLSNPHLETTTNLYIIPNSLVTITTNTDFISGSIATMEEMFVLVIDLIMYVSFLAAGLIILNVLIKRFTNHKRIELFVLLLALFSMIGCVVGFCFATSILSDATVGSILGSGEVNVAVYGENVFQKIPCSWGLNIGFYSFVFSIIVLISIFLYHIKDRFFKSKNYK